MRKQIAYLQAQRRHYVPDDAGRIAMAMQQHCGCVARCETETRGIVIVVGAICDVRTGDGQAGGYFDQRIPDHSKVLPLAYLQSYLRRKAPSSIKVFAILKVRRW